MSETPGGGIKFVIDADIPADAKIRQVTTAFRELQTVTGTGATEMSAAFKKIGTASETEGEKLVRMSKLYSTAGMSVVESAKFQGKSISEVTAALGTTAPVAQATAAAMHTVAASGKDVGAAFAAQLNPTLKLGEYLAKLQAAGFSNTQIFAVLNKEIQQASATALANQQAIHPLVGTYLGMATALQTAADAAMRMNAVMEMTAAKQQLTGIIPRGMAMPAGPARLEDMAAVKAATASYGAMAASMMGAANQQNALVTSFRSAANPTLDLASKLTSLRDAGQSSALVAQVYAREINTATTAAKGFGQVIPQIVTEHANLIPKVKEATGLLASMGITMSHVKNMAMGLLVYRVIWGAIEAVKGTIKGAIAAGMDFELSLARLKIASGSSSGEIKILSGEMRQLAKDIVVPVVELNKLATVIARGGIASGNLTGFTSAVAKFSEIAEIPFKESATELMQFMKNMREAPENISKVTSVIFEIGRASTSSEVGVMRMANRLSASFGTLGATTPQVVALAAAIADLGIRSERGASAMQAILIKMATAASEGGDKLAGFAEVSGMSMDKFAALMRTNVSAAITAFIDGLAGMSESGLETISVLSELDINEIRQLQTLLQVSRATENYHKFLKQAPEAYNAGTASSKAYAELLETSTKKIEAMKIAWYDLGITVGGVVAPIFAGMAEEIKSHINMVSLQWDFVSSMVEEELAKARIGWELIKYYTGNGSKPGAAPTPTGASSLAPSHVPLADNYITYGNAAERKIAAIRDKFIEAKQMLPEVQRAIQDLYKMGIPVTALYEEWGSSLDKWGSQMDAGTRRILEQGKELSEWKENLKNSHEEWRKIIDAMGEDMSGLKGIAKEVFPNAKEMELPEFKGVIDKYMNAYPQLKPGLMDIKESELDRYVKSFEDGRRSLQGQVAAAANLLSKGKDLAFVYEHFGNIIEKYPEYFDKAQWSAAQMGRMQETIRGGWLNIGNTIESAIGDSIAKMSFNIKSIFASIRDSWNQMIGDMVSSFLHGFLRPLMANLGNSMAALFGRTGFGAAMGGGGGMGNMGAIAATAGSFGGGSSYGGGGYAGGASGGGGWAGALGGSLGSILGGAGSGAMLGSRGGPYGAIAGGLGGGLLTAGLMGFLPHTTMMGGVGVASGGMSGALSGMGAFLTNPWTVGAAVAAIAGTLIYKSLTRGGTPAGAKESGRDYGVSVTSQTIEQFIASIGLSKSGYEGVRKDISSSPKFLTEVLFPQAKASGTTAAFLKSLESVSTAWGVFNFRSAFETWMKTGDATALNKAFIAAFGISQKLQEVLPDWQQQLMASGGDTKSTASRVGIHFNPTVTGPTYHPVAGAAGGGNAAPPVVVNITVEGYYDRQGAKDLFQNEIGPELLNQLSMNGPVRGRSVSYKSAMREALS